MAKNKWSYIPLQIMTYIAKLTLNDQWLIKWTLGRPRSQQDNIKMYFGQGTVCE
jgi:hypothetical protein